MKLWLKENGGWKLFEDVQPKDLADRNISIGDRSSIGDWSSIGEGSSIGDRSRIAKTADCVVVGPLGSRDAMLTGYRHKGGIMVGTGCFLGTISDFEKAVKENHKNNEHAKAYLIAVKFLKEKLA